PGQVHYWQLEEAVDGYVMPFLGEFLNLHDFNQNLLQTLDFFHSVSQSPLLYLDDQQAGDINKIIEMLFQEQQQIAFGRTPMMQSLLRILLIQLQRYYQSVQPQSVISSETLLVDQFQTLVEQHFLKHRTVQDYAAILGITAGYLSKVTKATTGFPASTVIRNRIVLEAKRLLAHSEQTVAEICHELQFEDPSYFGRFFKRETGQSPLQFRQNFRNLY
ncbi:MAG: AraC family transcriptional regulator, partial [Chloroflexota bacterium]